MVCVGAMLSSKNSWSVNSAGICRALFFAIVFSISQVGQVNAQSPAQIRFKVDVLPVLSRSCFPCHGPDENARQGNLRLDTKEGVLRADKPLVIPGLPGESRLFQRVISRDPEEQMPPPDAQQKLTENDVEVLRRWINDGATWSEHWSYRAVARPRSPVVDQGEWPHEELDVVNVAKVPSVHEAKAPGEPLVAAHNEIDLFIVDRLKQVGLKPSVQASGETLLRRVTLDLLGLPTELEAQREYFADERPDAFERVVDRLLASPHFGERWGRHWLDVARYADSSGFEGDPPRVVWKYRNWVLNAINDDLPFDEFVIQQLAGDLLPNATIDNRIATGFLLNSQQDGGSEPSRLDAVVDRVNTLGTVFLGLTVGCAQCHSHKFDPLTQREYYALFAFVNAADEAKLEFATPEQLARHDALAAQVASLTAERTTYAATLPAEKLKSDPAYLERSATIDALTSRIPTFESAQVLQPATPGRVTTMFIRGEFHHPGEPVSPDVPHSLPPLPQGPRTRLELARWLVNEDQPLTPRVTVNRVWQHLFGRGLVETENDFGTQGSRPTHPELLDWLASELRRRGWHLKSLIRQIAQSSTYRQASHHRADVDAIDSDNRWLARQSRLRLEAEVIRDMALAAGGLLSTKIGGPSVFPFQPDGIMINRATPASWTISPGEDRYRRGLYTHYWRLTPHPMLQTFDAPDAITTCTRRQSSNTPLQALTLLNDPMFTEAADAFAREIISSRLENDDFKVNRMFQLCLSRLPDDHERKLLNQVLSHARSRSTEVATGRSLSADSAELLAWTQLAQTILNLEEFVVRE